MNRKIIILFLLLFVLNNICISQNPINELNKLIYEDTIFITYGEGFNYDVVIIYANDIKIDEKILYSMKTTGNARASSIIVTNLDSIKLTVYLYNRIHEFSIEYNALWYNWSIKSDKALYYPAMKTNIVINKNNAKYVEISALENDKDKDIYINKPIKLPVIKLSNKSYKYD